MLTKITYTCEECGKSFEFRKAGKRGRRFCSRQCFAGDPKKRLMSKVAVDPATGCWNFTGSERACGYGQFKMKGQMYSSHRASWIIFKGTIPKGMLVLHSCIANRRCVNPDHLRLGTHMDNSNDMISQGRQHDQSGSKNHQAILNEEKVRLMRATPYFRGMYVHFSKLYGVEISVIQRAVVGKTWAHVK